MFASRAVQKHTQDQTPSRAKQMSQGQTQGLRQPEHVPESSPPLHRYLGNSYVQAMTATDGSGGLPAPSVPLRPSQSGILQRKCACGGSAGMSGECEECSKKQRLGLQTKLKVNEPGDIYEREADRIADQVLAMPVHHAVSGTPPRIQRFSGQSHGQVDAAPASVDHALASPGRPLEPELRQDMEGRFAYDFSKVRVHSSAIAEQSAWDVNANAYTTGHDIVFGAGRFAPGTQAGRWLLAHELTHVVQQSGSDGIRVGRSNEKRGLSPNYSMQVSGAEQPLYVQRTPGGGGAPTPPKADWLSGVTATHVQGNLYTIDLPGEGQVFVGPYQELDNYRIRNNLSFESHHIVGVEFIWMLDTGYTEATMPAVSLRPGGHAPITTSVNAQVSAHYGGRQGGRVQLTAREIAQIYNEAYTSVTPFTRLYLIANNILGRPKAPVKPPSGSPQVPPSAKMGPAALTTKLGTRVTAAAALVILGASYMFNWLIESDNEKRAKEEIEKWRPSMLKEQKDDPTLGFLLLFGFSGGVDSGEGPSASARFETLSWRRGYNEQEAKARWKAEAHIDRPGITYQFGWVEPLEAPSPEVLTTPFEKVWLAKFADISQIEFQRVEFKEWGGFDTNGKDGPINATKWDDAEGFRFIVLRMPPQVRYRNVAGRPDQMKVTIKDQPVIGGAAPALMLDGKVPAITVWPADAKTAALFDATHTVGDKEGKLEPLANVDLVRWLKPSQVKLLTKL
jgi:hypothetical protein